MQSDIPAESLETFDSEITAQGDDNTEYEGDENI